MKGRYTALFNLFILCLWVLDTIQLIALAQPPEVQQVFKGENGTSSGGFSNVSVPFVGTEVDVAFTSLRASILDFGEGTFRTVFGIVVFVTWFLLFVLGMRETRENKTDWSWITSNVLQPGIDGLILPIFSTLLGALGCSWDDSDSRLPILIRDNTLYCFTGGHLAIAASALITIAVTLPVFTFFRSDPSSKIQVGRIWFLRPFIILADSLKLVVIALNQYFPKASPYGLFIYCVVIIGYMLKGIFTHHPACHLKSAFYLKLCQLFSLLSVSLSIISYGFVSPRTTEQLSTTAPCLFFFVFCCYYFLFLFCRKQARQTWNYNDARSVQRHKMMKDVSIGVMGENDEAFRLTRGDLVLVYNQCGDSEGAVKWGHLLSGENAEDFIKVPIRKLSGLYTNSDDFERCALKDLKEYVAVGDMVNQIGEYITEWSIFFKLLLATDLMNGKNFSVANDSHAFESEAIAYAVKFFQSPVYRPIMLLRFPNLSELVNCMCDVTVTPKQQPTLDLSEEAKITLRTVKLAKVSLLYEIAESTRLTRV